MKALLIIDMQNGSFTPETPRHNAENVIKKINQLSTKFRKNNDPVIFIQHDGSRFDCFIPGNPDWKILSSLIKEESDLVISKTANDSFYKSQLHDRLKKLEITELVITGCATDFCVDSTIHSALAHDYDVTVIADAHTTADRPHLPAKKVIEHHNWVWSEMIPTAGKIEVIAFSSL